MIILSFWLQWPYDAAAMILRLCMMSHFYHTIMTQMSAGGTRVNHMGALFLKSSLELLCQQNKVVFFGHIEMWSKETNVLHLYSMF